MARATMEAGIGKCSSAALNSERRVNARHHTFRSCGDYLEHGLRLLLLDAGSNIRCRLRATFTGFNRLFRLAETQRAFGIATAMSASSDVLNAVSVSLTTLLHCEGHGEFHRRVEWKAGHGECGARMVSSFAKRLDE